MATSTTKTTKLNAGEIKTGNIKIGDKPIDKGKTIDIYDSKESGLILRMSKAGGKTFSYRYNAPGQSKTLRRFTIGHFPEVSLADARKRVRELRVDVLRGIDPQLEKQKLKQPGGTTFKELAETFETQYLKDLRPKTRTEYLRHIEKELLPHFKNFQVKDIDREHIIKVLDKIAIDRGAITQSNRVRSTISSMMSFAQNKGIIKLNPVSNIRKKKGEKKRRRFYSEDEIQNLWPAIEEQQYPIQQIYKMLFALGQRSKETCTMKWADINLEKDIWLIPEIDTKGKRSHEVPLNDLAISLLEELRPVTGNSDYVFESSRKKGFPTTNLQKATDRIKEITEISDFRVHDIRRTVATNMTDLGISREVLGKVLNHKGISKDDQVTAIYDRYDYLKEKRIALDKWDRKLNKILTDEPTKVLQMG